MTLSFSNLNEIGNLYESIAASEQEVLSEIGGIGGQKALDRVRSNMAAEKQSNSKLDAARTQRFGSGGSPSANKDSSGNTAKPAAPASGDYKSRFAGARDAAVARAQNIKGSPVVGPRPSAPAAPTATRPAAPKVSPSTPAKPAGPAIGKLGNTSFERRTPTSAELRAAQTARAGGASPEKALQAAQKTNLPTQGPTPAIPSASSVAADVAKANSPAVINRPAPAGSALARQQAAQRPATTAQATAAAPSASPAASGSVVPPTNAIAAAPRPKPMVPARAPAGAPLRPKPLFQSYDYEDVYDLVLEYLITEGYADTNESALAIMANMSEEWREEIIDEANRPEQEMIKKGLLKPGQVGRVRNLNRDSGNTNWYGQDPRDQPSIQRPGRSFGRTGPNKIKQRRQKDAQKFDAFYTSQRRDEHDNSRGKKTKG
jgi:hypothetical protein